LFLLEVQAYLFQQSFFFYLNFKINLYFMFRYFIYYSDFVVSKYRIPISQIFEVSSNFLTYDTLSTEVEKGWADF
jgi:hypothetical protein